MRAALAGLILALAAPLAATAQDAASGGQPALEDLRGTSRALVVFADSPDDPMFTQQMRLLEVDPAALEDRRVVVLTDTDRAARGPLRRELRPIGFGLVLIDIDGSVAQRRPLPTTVRELANSIDRMPSRRQETGSNRP